MAEGRDKRGQEDALAWNMAVAEKYNKGIIAELEADLWAVREAYNELIMAVGKKHPGETRHQTALRYIQQAERPTEAVVSQQAAGRTPQAPAAEPGSK